jgi:hypothetical protein
MKSLASVITLVLLSVAVCADSKTLTFQEGDGGAYSSTQAAYFYTLSSKPITPTSVLTVASVYDLPTYVAILRFPNIIGSNPGQIPPGSSIQSATLQLTRSMSTTYAAGLRLVTTAWNERNLSGANDPATGAGAGSIPAGDAGAHSADVTAAVQAWATGTDNWGLEIWPGFSTTKVNEQFYSDKVAAVAQRPRLTVTFTSPTEATEQTTWGHVKALYR